MRARLSGGVGRLEPVGASDLPHERPPGLARGYRGLCARGRRGAGADPGGGGDGRLFDRRVSGRRAARGGRGAGRRLGCKAKKVDVPKAEDGAYAISPLWQVPGKGRAWLDFQNDVTDKDVKLAAQENFRSVEHMKRYTTQGHGDGSGQELERRRRWRCWPMRPGAAIPETGTTTFRPPYTPVSIAAMGAGAQGTGFAPQRFTTSHAASVAARRADDRGGAVVSAHRISRRRARRPGASPATARWTWCATPSASPMSRPWARSTFRGRMRRSCLISSIPTRSRP